MVENPLVRAMSNWLVRGGFLGACLFSVLALTFWLPELMPYRIDIDVYRLGGQAVLEGNDLYGPLPDTEIGANLPFTYPPIAALIFAVFALVPLSAASTAISLISLGCLAWVCCLVVAKTADLSLKSASWFALPGWLLLMWLGPVRETIEFGQINLVLMALVLTDVLLLPRKARGWLVGLAIAIKLTPAVFLAYFFLQKDWRGMVQSGVSFLVFTGLGFVFLPSASIAYWTGTLSDTSRIGNAGYPSNLSINGIVHRAGLLGSEATLAWFGVSLVVGVLLVLAAWLVMRQGQRVAAALIIGLAGLFCSPVSWGHHWVWALPLLLIFGVWIAQRLGNVWLWGGLLATGVWVFWAEPQWWFPFEQDTTPDWDVFQQFIASGYLLWAGIAVIVMASQARRLRDPAGMPAKVWFPADRSN